MALNRIEYYIGDQYVDIEIKRKEEAEEIVKIANFYNNSTMLAKKEDNCVTISLGLVPKEVQCRVIMSFVGRCSFIDSNTVKAFIPFNVANERSLKINISKHEDLSYFKANGSILDIQSGQVAIEPNEALLEIEMKFKHSLTNQGYYENVNNDGYLTVPFWYENTELSKNADFVFVVDCSGSMNGSPILHVSQTLQFFIKSLPVGCSFDIIRFGSTYRPLFHGLTEYNEESAATALELAENLKADLGGTNLFKPLNSLMDQATSGRFLQVFVLTDGEVMNRKAVIDLVDANRNKMRIFSFGIGFNVDSYLVQCLAEKTKGKSVFIHETVEIEQKVMSQMKAAMAPAGTNLQVQVENVSTIEVMPNPIPLTFGNDATFLYIKTPGMLINEETQVLLTYQVGRETFDVVIDKMIQCGTSFNKTLFDYQGIHDLELDNQNSSNVEKIIKMSLESRILSKFTGFVGQKTVQNVSTSHRRETGKRSTGGCTPRKPLNAKACRKSVVNSPIVEKKSEKVDETPLNKILKLQAFDGSFNSSEELFNLVNHKKVAKFGMFLKEMDTKEILFATCVGIALLKKYCQDQKDIWEQIAEKSMHWLNNMDSSINWEEIISNIIKKLE